MNEEPKKPNEDVSAAAPTSATITGTPDNPNVVVLPPEALREAVAKGTGLQLTIATSHSGPLPAPATLRAYDGVIPGLSGVIVDEFTKETKHRRRLQNIGQIGALGVAGSAIICGVLLGFLLQSALAALAVIGPVCGVVGTAQLLELWFKGK